MPKLVKYCFNESVVNIGPKINTAKHKLPISPGIIRKTLRKKKEEKPDELIALCKMRKPLIQKNVATAV